MSSWSQIRANASDPLSGAINDLIVKSNQNEAITDQLDISDKISPIRIIKSKLELSDKDLTSFICRPVLSQIPNASQYYSPLEPDGSNVKIDAKFDSGGNYLTDYSYMGNQIEIGYNTALPILLKNTDDDGMTAGEIASKLDGSQHYYKIQRIDNNSIKKMYLAGKDGFTIVYRCYTIKIENELNSSNTRRATFFYYVENDQMEYAVKAETTDRGVIYMYVRMGGTTTYWGHSQDEILSGRDYADYRSPDYDTEDYDAISQEFILTYPIAYQDFAFQFDFVTHQIKIFVNGVEKTVIQGTPNPIPAPFPPSFADPPVQTALTEPYITPFLTVYNQPIETGSLKIYPGSTAELVPIYNVTGSPPTTDPITLKYYVQGGTQTTGTTTQSLGGLDTTDDSWIPLCKDTSNSNNCSKGALQIMNSSSGVGAAIVNHVINQATFWVNGQNGPTGNIYCRIWDGSGNVVRTLGTSNSASTDGVQMAITFSDPNNSTAMQVGYRIGLEYTEGATNDVVRIQRAGSDKDASTQQSVMKPGSSTWANNTTYDLRCSFVEGIATAGTQPYTPLANRTGQTTAQVEYFKTNSPMIGNVPTLVELKVFRDSSATSSGTVFLRHYNSALAVKSTLASISVASLPTSDTGTYNFVWQDTNYPNAILANESIGIEVSGVTSGFVYILTNYNDTYLNDYDGANSMWTYKKDGSWYYNASLDLAGRISKGGASFGGYIFLDDTRKRTGIKVDETASPIIGKKVTKVTATFKRFGSPTPGLLYCRIRDKTGTVKTTLGSVDINTISQFGDTDVDFTNTDSNYIMLLDDTISLEYDAGTATDLIMVRVATEVYDGNNTILFESFSSNINVTSPVVGRDLAATIFIGGQVDRTARPMRGLKIATPNSSLVGKSITEIRVKLKATGSLPLQSFMHVYILQNQTHFIKAYMGQIDHATIPTNTFTEFSFQNVDNNYVLKTGDMIAFHFIEGDLNNYIEIKTSATNVYEGTNTIMFEWLGRGDTNYIDDPLHDLTATMYSGGFLVTPDPASIPPPVPYHYVHGWYIASAIPPDSGALVDPFSLLPPDNTYLENISRQFRVYSLLLNTNQLQNYYQNRWTVSYIPFQRIDVVGYSAMSLTTI